MNSVFKTNALLCAVIAWTAAASAQDVPDAITLDDALALALAHSPRLEAFDWERRAADARIVQSFNFMRLPWAVLIGWVLFAELPDLWTWVGAVVIFAGAYDVLRRETRRP